MTSVGELPVQLNDPFCYEPHPLCVEAARQVCDYLSHSPLNDEVMQGKMLGVLVCQAPDGQVGFLAAYSGQLGGRADWPWFVPAVFDYLQPDGYFKREEAAISAINHAISRLESSSDYVSAKARLAQLTKDADKEISDYRKMMQAAKVQRDALRGVADSAELIRESQFQKAELHRMKKRWEAVLAEAAAAVQQTESRLDAMKQERKQRSDALQHWLFDHFVMLNDQGQRRTLTDIFADTPQHVPPSGTGECCAPKLLQYAFANGLKPLSIAEFWQGASPRQEVRHHGHYYPACRGKCKPVLGWMLKNCTQPSQYSQFSQLSQYSQNSQQSQPSQSSQQPHHPHALRVLSEDSALLVVDKPAGLLSVPGLTGEESVESLLRRQYGEVYMVHRLDQDTSGMMVVARTRDAYHLLQRQFLERTIDKMYIAVVDGIVEGSGTIRLPLRPDPLDRPRQVVDHEQGKEAVTDYRVLDRVGQGRVRLALTPHTGRTHQLRMHCAHQEGLGCPIVGDRLYGKPAERLLLHAAKLSFTHPSSGERLNFVSPAPF